jgi:phosphonate metabolism-associated iron-containing alcohol dehydrogenase
MSWSFFNPVNINFESGALAQLPMHLKGRTYALLTYNEPYFSELAARIAATAGEPVAVVNNIAPNPDMADMEKLSQELAQASVKPEVLVALGGGSVIDTAKALAATQGSFSAVEALLKTGSGREALCFMPIIAIPTTAGTGSEVTCWATVWDKAAQKKFSLADPCLYPEVALCDPELTLGLPTAMTISTGLDALSHALESIWNKNRNPLSSSFAIAAVRLILDVLPKLAQEPQSVSLREQMMEGALKAGMAFSNTKTSIAHNISYDVTLQQGTVHGIACAFTLPQIMRSVLGQHPGVDVDLQTIFGCDLHQACDDFEAWFKCLNIETSPQSYGYDQQSWQALLDRALQGERGKNFIGQQHALLSAYASTN